MQSARGPAFCLAALEGDPNEKVFVATLAAAACAAAAVTPARAANEGAIVGAAVGGLAVGTIIGSAAARPYYAYPAYAPAAGLCRLQRIWRGLSRVLPGRPLGARKPVAFDRAGRPVAWVAAALHLPAY
jgi:hypothetical protein